MNILVGIMLTVCAIEDLYTKKITVLWPVTGMTIAVTIRLSDDSFFVWEYWIGVLVGVLLFLLAIVSREQIGKGDGLVLAVCGFCLGWKQTLSLMLGAMIMFLIVGVISIVYRNKSRNTVMAYVPFLWAVFMISLIICGGG